jgi:hypothetical protein
MEEHKKVNGLENAKEI